MHARLTGADLSAVAHIALSDAQAVSTILSDPAVWAVVTKEPVWRPVTSITAHADILEAADVNKARGWKRADRPKCTHGVMVHSCDKVFDAATLVNFPDGHKVVFRCRNKFHRCQTDVEHTTYPGYVVQEVVKVPKARGAGSKKSTGGVVKGVAGACGCTSKCMRGCPCKLASQHCTKECLNHKRNSCKCVNRPPPCADAGVEAAPPSAGAASAATVPPPGVGAAHASAPTAVRPQRPGRGRAVVEADSSEADSSDVDEGSDDDSDSNDGSDDDSDSDKSITRVSCLFPFLIYQ